MGVVFFTLRGGIDLAASENEFTTADDEPETTLPLPFQATALGH